MSEIKIVLALMSIAFGIIFGVLCYGLGCVWTGVAK